MGTLAEILGSRTRAEVFRLLFGPTGTPRHTRELQRRCGVQASTLQQEARKLTRLGLLLCRRDGNRVYYEANREHPLYPEIHLLVLKTVGLVDVLREALTDPHIRWAFVFGSVASGTEKAESDIDLMIVGPLGLRQAVKLLSGVTQTLGREVNPHVFTEKEFRTRLARHDHFLTAVMASPRLLLIGDEHELAAVAE